jgi:hypothetical protein
MADPAVTILIGATTGGSRGVLIHQLEDLHRRGIGLVGGRASYGREDGSSRGGEESSPTGCVVSVSPSRWSMPSTTLCATSKSCGLQAKALVLLEGRSYGGLVRRPRPFAVEQLDHIIKATLALGSGSAHRGFHQAILPWGLPHCVDTTISHSLEGRRCRAVSPWSGSRTWLSRRGHRWAIPARLQRKELSRMQLPRSAHTRRVIGPSSYCLVVVRPPIWSVIKGPRCYSP